MAAGTALSSVSGPAPNEDGMLLLEAPFARVPHDELRRHLRTQQRHVERDLTFCSSTLESLVKAAKGSSSATAASTPATAPAPSAAAPSSSAAGDTSRDADSSFLADVSFSSEVGVGDSSLLSSVGEESFRQESPSTPKKGTELERSLDVMIGRIKGLKRKLASVHDLTGPTLTRLDKRTQHLTQLHGIQSISSPSFEHWCRTRLDRMLIDWLLRKGYLESAEMLARSRQIEDFTELSLFSEIARIESSLIGQVGEDGKHSGWTCAPTLAWCSENKAALRKIRSSLEFDLRLQEFIELARNRTDDSLQEALAYCRKYLLPYLTPLPRTAEEDTSTKDKSEEKDDAEEHEQADALRREVSCAMGLLACGPQSKSYHHYYAPTRWEMLRDSFRKAALQIHSLPRQPTLHIALSAGLSSLKLPACYSDDVTSANATMPPAHLGGRAFGDERSNLLSVAGVTSTSVSEPTFPPAAGIAVREAAPAVVVSEPAPTRSAMEGVIHGGSEGANGTNGTCAPRNSLSPRPSTQQAKNNDCPVCDSKGLGVLAKEVPWSHHANSTLVCSISGKMMNENDPPMALPNGRVYSIGALQDLAASSHDGETIVCPRTGDVFNIDSLRKVYIS